MIESSAYVPGMLTPTPDVPDRDDRWELVPATISFYDLLSTNPPLVVIDGDSEPLPAIQLINARLAVNDRVWVQRVPPGGLYIVGRAVNSGYVFSSVDDVAVSLGASASYAASSRSLGVAFLAPTSGVVEITIRASTAPAVAALAWTSVRIGEDSIVGSGTVFQAASDNYAILVVIGTAGNGGDFGTAFPISGLTPGRVYNAQMQHKTSSGTSFWSRRQIMVDPK